MKLKSLFLNLTLALGAFRLAQAGTIVPGGFETTSGNGQSSDPFRNYGTGGSRFQQVYDASLFTTFTDAELITSVAFRPKQPDSFLAFIGNTLSISDIIVQLSTTSKNDVGTLSGIFADNIGADVTTVYSGALTLTAGPAAASGPNPFDYLITFQTPFLYEKSMGNLLLDILIPDAATVSGSGIIGFRQLDTITDAFPSADGLGTARGASGSATIGSNSTLAVVTQFTSTAAPQSVPDTGSLFAMLVPVLGGLHLARRRFVSAAPAPSRSASAA